MEDEADAGARQPGVRILGDNAMQTNPAAGWPQAVGNVSLPGQALDGRITLQGVMSDARTHRAWDSLLERPVAVTFLEGADPWDLEWLLVEARLQARVDHPNVVKVHAVGTLGERPCVVSQVVEGRTLADAIPELHLPARVDLVRQAAEGVHAAHVHGLLHRCLSPSSVLVEQPEGGGLTALVTGLGLARGSRGGHGPDAAAGRLDFMSPEQIIERAPADQRSDVYSLGATLFAVVSGRPPHNLAELQLPAGQEKAAASLRQILDKGAPSLVAANPRAPRALALIAAKAMARDPAARYQSAEALAGDLARFQAGQPIRARRAASIAWAARWGPGRRIAAGVLVIALAAVAIEAGWLAWSARRRGLAALEVARAGKSAASMEVMARAELTGPPHDLRPGLARIRAEVDSFRAAAGRSGGGPASYTVGRGLELLGDLEGARAAYGRAWDMGYLAPEVGAGMGIVLIRLYQREAQRADETLDPAARDDRLRALRVDLLEPARRYLQGSGGTDARGPQLTALVALAQGEYDSARKAAVAALAADPGRYEARGLRGEAWLGQARKESDEQHLAEAEAALAEARTSLAEALQWGRSDPRLLDLLAEVRLSRASVLGRRGQDTAAEVNAALVLLERAEALNPAETSVLVRRALTLLEKAKLTANAGQPDALPLMDRAVELLRRAVAVDPRQARPQAKLALALHSRAFYLRETGSPSLMAAREGLAVVADAVARAPKDPEIAYDSMLLRLEEAAALARDGRDATEALRRAVADGEEALRLRWNNPAKARLLMGEALVQLGREAWWGGRDPRPDLSRGVDLSEQGRRDMPKNPAGATYLASALATSADLLLDMGETAQAQIARGLAVVNEALRARPAQPALRVLKGEMALLEARRRAFTGGDSLAALAEARRSVSAGADAGANRASAQTTLATISLLEARWSATRGKEPTRALADAEDHFREMLRRRRTAAAGYEGLAACALERALWLRRGGKPGDEEALRGLSRLDQALEMDSRDPLIWVLKARLQILAGDKDSARGSLSRAYTANPLARGSDEARRAESELGG